MGVFWGFFLLLFCSHRLTTRQRFTAHPHMHTNIPHAQFGSSRAPTEPPRCLDPAFHAVSYFKQRTANYYKIKRDVV